MEINVESLLTAVSEQVKSHTSTEQVIGEEFQMGEYTCRPVIKIGAAFGGGGATGDDPKKKSSGTGEGGAAGMAVVPLGFLVTKGEEISFIQVKKNAALSGLLDKMPDLMEKMMEKKKEGETKEEPKAEAREEKKDTKA
jgi:uncharacterized spore protein YtfJ